MKKLLSVIMILALLSGSLFCMDTAVALTGSNTYYGADSDGAYCLSFSGRHADLVLYPSGDSYYVDLSYDIAAGTAGFGKAVFLSDDVENDMLIVHIYDPFSNELKNFAINGLKAFGNALLCYDGDSVYISDDRETNILYRYSSDGNLLNTYRFDNRAAQVFCDYKGSVYAVSRNKLYYLSDGIIPLSGDSVTTPLFPIGNDYVVSHDGKVYDIEGFTVKYMFSADSSSKAAGGCIAGNLYYYPNGTVINGYDIASGEKCSYYNLPFSPDMLYTIGNSILAIGNGTANSIRIEQFSKIEKPLDKSPDVSGSNPSKTERADSELRSDVYKVDFSAYTISRIPPDTTAAVLRKNMIYTGYNVRLYKGNSELKAGNVGTACTAVFSNDKESIRFELSVTGDLTGEGRMNSRDLNILMDYMIGAADFNGVYTLSADINNDSKVNAVDMAMLKRNQYK